MEYAFKKIESQFGTFTLISYKNKLAYILFDDQEIPYYIANCDTSSDQAILTQTELQLNEYFNGKRKSFDIELDPEGTDFQKKVWNELQKIPYGETISYQELATRCGSKNYSRAVGSANGKNPLPIIIPCHRVINKSGKLGGYAGGLELKRKLLELEKNTRY